MIKLFFIGNDGKIENLEYRPFGDEVNEMQPFFKNNIKLLGDSLQFVAEKVTVPFGNTIREIDLFAFDRDSFRPVIIELKKGEADEKVLLQVLRYASWAKNNPDSVKYLLITKGGIAKEEIEENEDKLSDVKIIIVAEKFKSTLLSLSQYISSFQIDFVRYKRFIREKGGTNEVIIAIEYITPPREAYTGVSVSEQIESIENYKNIINNKKIYNLIKKTYDTIVAIIESENLEIRPNPKKGYIPFQIRGPINNIIEIRWKKTQPPDLALRLGRDADIASLGLKDIGIKIRQDRNNPDFWIVTIDSVDVLEKLPLKKLIKFLYEKYTG